MTTRERIDADYSQAAKARNASVVSTLRLLRTALKYAEIEKMKPLTEEEVIDVIGREAKKLKDAIDSYAAGQRQDLVQSTEEEMTTLKQYLPAQLDDEALKKIIADKIAALGAATIRDLGRVMGEVSKETKGRADGSKVSALVKAALAGPPGGT